MQDHVLLAKQTSDSPPDLCADSEIITIDFSTDANGTALNHGDYIKEEWLLCGLTITASGGFGDMPRIFDTSLYKTKDPDL